MPKLGAIGKDFKKLRSKQVFVAGLLCGWTHETHFSTLFMWNRTSFLFSAFYLWNGSLLCERAQRLGLSCIACYFFLDTRYSRNFNKRTFWVQSENPERRFWQASSGRKTQPRRRNRQTAAMQRGLGEVREKKVHKALCSDRASRNCTDSRTAPNSKI